jgi:protein deglycase
MKERKALLFIYEGYCEFEISTAISMLRSTHDLHICAVEKRLFRSEAGLNTYPDLSIDEVVIDEYDVLIIPGGDLQPILEEQLLFDLVNSFSLKGKIIAAICSGGYVLAKAKVLNDIPYTVTLTKEQRKCFGCFQEEHYSYQPLVVCNNILTAQGHAYVDYGIQLNKMVKEVSVEVIDFYRGNGNTMMQEV